MKFVSTLTGLLLAILGFGISSTLLQASTRSELRGAALGVLDELVFREDAALAARLAPLVLSYRMSSQRLPTGTVSIADGPFLGFVLQNKVPELYAAAYDTNYAEQYDKNVVHPSLEFIFDQFLQAYLEGTLPPELARSAGSLGPCLAKKVQRGKSVNCVLDENESHLGKPSTISLAGAKFGCHLGIPNACNTRVLIFNQAKEDLVKARRDHALAGPFNAIFPKKFREEFLKDLSKKRATLPELVTRKFSGELGPLWGPNVALIDSDESSLSMKGFAQGLQADLRIAARLSHSTDLRERGMASALFYAAANRILLMTGGTQAGWDGSGFKATDSFDPKEPKRAPILMSENYGGWSLGNSKEGPISYAPWDWAAYDPTRTEKPTPLQIFPSILNLGAHGVPSNEAGAAPVERLEDLAELISAFTEFLRATRPGAALGDHFGKASDVAKLLDPESPMIFPTEGRLLAYGALAGVLKNIAAPIVGHLEKSEAGTPQGGLGLVFHDGVRIGSRDGTAASTLSIARLFLAASSLKAALMGDPDVPPELLAQVPELDSALQVGALSLGAQAQNADGGFMENLTLPQAPSAAPTGRKLVTTIESLRALTRAYEASHILIIKLSIKAGWKYLDPYFSGDSAVPSESLSSGDLWSLVQLWNETQKAIRPGITTEVDWAQWERRMTALRARLVADLG